MKKSILVALAIVGAGVAQADNYPYMFSVRLGVIIPVDKSYSKVSDSFVGLGIDYAFERSFIAGGESYASLEYQGKDFGRTKGSVVPLLINQKWFIGEEQPGKRAYYFGGLGVAFVDYGGTQAAVAARVGVGKELNEHVFGEATLNITDRAAGIRANSVGVYLGYRF